MALVNYIYHYTTIDALKGILKSKTLWLSSCRGYKDEEESRLVVYSPNPSYDLKSFCIDKKIGSKTIIRKYKFSSRLELEIISDSDLSYVDNSMALKGIYCKDDDTMHSVKKLVQDFGFFKNVFI